MRFNVGDMIFTRNGQPGIVTSRNPETAELVVQTKGEDLEKTKRRGYINGLTVEERDQFNKVIDEVKALEKPEERIMQLRAKIEETAADPRQRVLNRYLSAEMAHLMNTYRFEPREYKTPEWEAK